MKKRNLIVLPLLLAPLSFLHAEPTIIVDKETKMIYVMSGDQKVSVDDLGNLIPITGTSTITGSIISSGSTTTGSSSTGSQTPPILDTDTLSAELASGTELEKAIYRMFKNGLTKYDTVTEYRPTDGLLREEAAKIIGQLYAVLGYDQGDKGFNCSFSDTSEMDPTLTSYIQQVCKRGVFKGSDGQYMPRSVLTKEQALAVLIRIFEGKLSNENQIPWRHDYYVKSKAISLTNENNINNIERPVTREEIALLVYRFKKLALDESLKKTGKEIIDDVNANPSKYTPTSGSSTSGSSSLSDGSLAMLGGGGSIANDPELNEAIGWMHDNGITSYSSVSTYRPFDGLTRAEAAKMFDKFAQVMGLNTQRNLNECSFSDISSLSADMQANIVNVCKYGIMKGSNKKFEPNAPVNKAQFIATLIRLFEGKSLDETSSPWRTNYFEAATSLGIVSPQEGVTFENPITRYEVALYLYRFKVRKTMLDNLNTEILWDEIITTVPDTTETASGKQSANIYIDVTSITNGKFNQGYVEVFGSRYKVNQSSVNKYNLGEYSYVWYGDIIDIETDQKVGTISFIISNGNVVEGTIRINKNNEILTYKILKNPNTSANFNISEV